MFKIILKNLKFIKYFINTIDFIRAWILLILTLRGIDRWITFCVGCLVGWENFTSWSNIKELFLMINTSIFLVAQEAHEYQGWTCNNCKDRKCYECGFSSPCVEKRPQTTKQHYAVSQMLCVQVTRRNTTLQIPLIWVKTCCQSNKDNRIQPL